MPPASRALVIALITSAGLLAGFVSYRSLRFTGAGHLTGAAAPLTPALLSAPAGGADGSDTGPAPEAVASGPIPEQLPDLRLPDLTGTARSLRDYIGRPLIINFWATWCAPCRREMPLLQQLRRDYAPQGLEVVGIAVDFRAAVADYVRDRGIDYPLLVGEDQGLAAAESFGMQTVLPFSVFADSQGRIIALKIGELHRDEADYILVMMHALQAGRLNLADARSDIRTHLQALAVAHAKAAVNGP